MENPLITFDKLSQKDVLAALGIQTDSSGYLVDSDGKRIIAFDDGQEIMESEFGGAMKGKSGLVIFFKSDLPSLIRVLDEIQTVKKGE